MSAQLPYTIDDLDDDFVIWSYNIFNHTDYLLNWNEIGGIVDNSQRDALLKRLCTRFVQDDDDEELPLVDIEDGLSTQDFERRTLPIDRFSIKDALQLAVVLGSGRHVRRKMKISMRRLHQLLLDRYYIGMSGAPSTVVLSDNLVRESEDAYNRRIDELSRELKEIRQNWIPPSIASGSYQEVHNYRVEFATQVCKNIIDICRACVLARPNFFARCEPLARIVLQKFLTIEDEYLNASSNPDPTKLQRLNANFRDNIRPSAQKHLLERARRIPALAQQLINDRQPPPFPGVKDERNPVWYESAPTFPEGGSKKNPYNVQPDYDPTASTGRRTHHMHLRSSTRGSAAAAAAGSSGGHGGLPLLAERMPTPHPRLKY